MIHSKPAPRPAVFLNNLSYNFSGSYYISDGYRDNSNTEAKDIGANLDYFVSNTLKLNFSGGYHKDSTGLPGAIKTSEFTAGASRTDSLHPDDFADVEDYYFQGRPEIYFLNNSLFKIDISFRKRNSLAYASFGAGSFEGDTEIKTLAVSPQIIIKEDIGRMNNSLIFGFDYYDSEEDITNTSIFFGALTKGVYQLEKKNYGYYIHDEINLSDNLIVSGGYRYDRAKWEFRPSTPDHTTMDKDLYTAGINYKYHNKSYLYFSFSRSFRYPVLDEIYSFFTNTIDLGLIPQTSDNYESGIRHFFSESLSANINFYRIETENEIIYNPASFMNENLDGKTRRDGIEVSITKSFKNITLNGCYTYTDATIRGGQYAGKDVPNTPPIKQY